MSSWDFFIQWSLCMIYLSSTYYQFIINSSAIHHQVISYSSIHRLSCIYARVINWLLQTAKAYSQSHRLRSENNHHFETLSFVQPQMCVSVCVCPCLRWLVAPCLLNPKDETSWIPQKIPHKSDCASFKHQKETLKACHKAAWSNNWLLTMLIEGYNPSHNPFKLPFLYPSTLSAHLAVRVSAL